MTTRITSTLKGLFLGWIARLWLSTLRVRFVASTAYELAARDPNRAPWVYCFFHGTQFSLLAWRRPRATSVMVSHSRDGEMQAKALAVQGMSIVRGSSSRGGARALVSLVKAMRGGHDAAFAVDGPRGPYGVVKAGALAAAQKAGGALVPLGVACSHAFTFEKAWDKFLLPWPFSRVFVVAGDPLPRATTCAELEAAIRKKSRDASKLNTLGRSASNPEEAYFSPSGGQETNE